MRGANCIDASVSVINRIAKTMDTTVMMEAAITPKMSWATCGSECEGNSVTGTRSLAAGIVSSSQERSAPTHPKANCQRADQKPTMRIEHGLSDQEWQTLIHGPSWANCGCYATFET